MKKISDWFAEAKAGVRRNVGTKIVAMVAAVAMLGGVAGVSMTAMAEEGQTPDVQTAQQANPATDTATTNDDASTDGAATDNAADPAQSGDDAAATDGAADSAATDGATAETDPAQSAGDAAQQDAVASDDAPAATDIAKQSAPAPADANASADAQAVDAAPTGSLLVDETFKNSTFSDSTKWSTKDGACLTASGCSSTTDTRGIQSKGNGTGYLQLTDGSTGTKGSVLYNQAIPSGNGLDITFDYYMYGGKALDGTNGDGISFFLTDGAATLSQTGAGGAGMGYASVDEDGAGSGARVEGIAQGVLGIGLDEFGNFSKQSIYSSGSTDRVTGGNDCTVPYNNGSHTVTLRGKGAQDSDGKWNNGYCVVAGAHQNDSFRTDPATASEDDSNGKTVRVLISEPNADGYQTVTVYIDGVQVVSHTLDYKLPTSIKFGFSAGTGAASQAQLIRGLSAHSVKSLTAIDLVKAVSKDAYPDADTHIFKSGDKVPYVFTVTNGGTTTLNNVTVTDPNISNIKCPSTTLDPGNPMTCTGELTLTDALVKDGKFTNTATATGTDGTKNVSDTDSVTINTVKPLGAPDHHKKIQSNGNGSYTLNLDVVGDSTEYTTTTVQPLDIALVLDVSGSMADDMDSYTEAYNPSTRGTYYVLANGQYQKLSYNSGTLWDSQQGWYYGNWPNQTYVTPKTGADDTDASHTQFYTRTSTAKIQALKNAVNNFINATAAENAKISEQTQGQGDLNQIALVKFAGTASDNVGNDHYWNDYWKQSYNNTQVVSNLTSDLSGLANTVTSLDAAGATRADYGFQKAQVALQSARPNAKKVVIFFTDGQPTSGSEFEASVANDAIANSKKLKDAGVTVYSIGVVDGADPNDTTSDLNRYMHGVSSNYPNATSYTNLGTRAENSSYYKAASSADELNSIFNAIQHDVSGTAYSNVSITDELSKYVQQSGIKTSGNADGNGFYTVTDGVKLTVTDASGTEQKLDADQYTLLFNPGGNGTVKVQFAPGYKLQKGWTYTLFYNVDLTQTAYDEYAANNGGYDDVTGHEGTDINTENPTSSGQPGFHSNNRAYVTYTADGKTKETDYDHPVVQAADGSLQVKKDWDPVTPGADSVTVHLLKDGKDTGKTVTLSASNSWTDSFYHLAPGYKYTVSEDPVGGYTSGVEYSKNDTVITGENPSVDLVKDDVWANPKPAYKAVITNTAKPAVLKGDTALGLVKKVQGSDWTRPGGKDFSFTLTCENNTAENGGMCTDVQGLDSGKTTLGASTTGDITQNSGETVHFGELTFTKTGTYTFTISEDKGDAAGWSYDSTEHQVTVSVALVKDQGLVATVKYGDKSELPVFTNTFIAVSSLPLTGGTTARDWLVYGGGMGLAALLAGAGFTVWRKRQLV